LINELSRRHRKSTASTTSALVPGRPTGFPGSRNPLAASRDNSRSSTIPGETTLNVMPPRASSRANVLVSETMLQQTPVTRVLEPYRAFLERFPTLVACAATPVAEVVDTTGAGDLYAAGFLYGLTHGLDPAACAQLGSVCAAEAVGHLGARPQKDLVELARGAGLL